MRLKELINRISLSRTEEFPFPEDLESFLEGFIPDHLLKNETLQKAFGVSNYEMEEIYLEAYSFYQSDDYLESSTGFRWLVLLNPFKTKYWMGLAASLQLLQKYEKALHAYAISALLDIENPYPHFYAFKCYTALKNEGDAAIALNQAWKLTVSADAYRDLQEEIEKEHPHVLRNTDPDSHTSRNLSFC